MNGINPIRLLLVGRPATELRLAADMARDAGAEVRMADDDVQGLAALRSSGAALVMIDVDLDVGGFMAQLRAERFAVPVLACGIDAPADRAVAAIRAGACDYVPLPPQRDLIAAAITSVVPQQAVALIGKHPPLRHALAFALRLGHSATPMLLSGESGTGKQAMARVIHNASGRPGSFCVAECAGADDEVVASELFGHERGAFAGALARRIGRMEEAAGGTLFLSNIDCLTPALQAQLLAALQHGFVRRIGGVAPVPFNVRLIAGTSSDLKACVMQGSFRADLFARLTLVSLTLPPLREREGDIALLAGHFAERLAASNGLPPRTMGDEVLALLAAYAWPGNVRELEDVIHRAVLLAPGPEITPNDIVLIDGSRIMAHHAAAGSAMQVGKLVGRTVEDVERELILETLRRCRGNRTAASGILGISVRTMRNKLKCFIEAGIAVAPSA